MGNLDGDEGKVYDLIVRHFLASCSKDAKGSETDIGWDVCGERFKCKGLEILDKGYLEIWTFEKWGEIELPEIR